MDQSNESAIGARERERGSGWFRPFCLALLVMILVSTCLVGGAVVLLVRQVITLPPNLIAAITGSQAPIVAQATTVLEKVQAMSQLTTMRYNYSSLVTSQREVPPGILSSLYGDKLIMVAVGHVNAGMDLRQLTPASVTRQGDKMTIRLPPPQLLDCFLDEPASYVVSRDTGVFARPAPNLDATARRYAVGQFRDMANKDDIYTQVQDNAKVVISSFVSGLGVSQVEVITTPHDPNAPLPSSCQ